MSAEILPLLSKALGETVYMVAVSMALASIIGVPLGILFHTTEKGQILENAPLGRFIIGLSGEEAEIQSALNFLGGKDVRVEVIGYVRRNSAAA